MPDHNLPPVHEQNPERVPDPKLQIRIHLRDIHNLMMRNVTEDRYTERFRYDEQVYGHREAVTNRLNDYKEVVCGFFNSIGRIEEMECSGISMTGLSMMTEFRNKIGLFDLDFSKNIMTVTGKSHTTDVEIYDTFARRDSGIPQDVWDGIIAQASDTRTPLSTEPPKPYWDGTCTLEDALNSPARVKPFIGQIAIQLGIVHDWYELCREAGLNPLALRDMEA